MLRCGCTSNREFIECPPAFGCIHVQLCGVGCLPVAGIVQEPGLHLRDADHAGREGGAAELPGVDARALGEDEPPEVAVAMETLHLLDAHDLVHGLVANVPQHLDDVLRWNGLPALELHLVPHQPLHGVDYELALPKVHRKVEDVADPEAGRLPDGGRGALLVCHHGVVGPRVLPRELVHGHHHVEAELSGHGEQALVRHPGHQTGHRQVLPPADDADLLCRVLHASPDVLRAEGTHADDDNVLVLYAGVVGLVEHAVADLALEDVLALVGHALRRDEAAREHADGGHLHDQLVAELRRAVGHGHAQVVGLHEAARVTRVLHDVHGRHVRPQSQVGRDAVLLAHLVEVLQKLQPARLRLHARGVGVVGVVLEVVDRELRLQLRGGVGVVDPSGAADDAVAVE
mmetsp:Transcript_28856/g.89831  ORF Transcript_28856/g.89831 Transcript_28856/m.89831 type:complete len:402 (+) Transcript_28856:696-1901(+)